MVGYGLLAIAAVWTYRIANGLSKARSVIADFESQHGKLTIVDGYWSHAEAPVAAARAFCDELSAIAGWVYPFHFTVWVPVLVLWFFGIALGFRARYFPLVFLPIAVLALSYADVYATVIAVLE